VAFSLTLHISLILPLCSLIINSSRFQFLRFWFCMFDFFHEIGPLDVNKLRWLQ
jgi:hypothetical protein